VRIRLLKVPTEAAHFIRRMPALMGTFFVLLPGVALADCPDGARDATAQEKETAVRVLTILRDSFAAPPGWKVTKDTSPKAPRTFCKGTTLLRLWFERRMTRVDGMNERRTAYDRRLTEAKRLTPDEQRQVKEIDQEIADLAKQMGVPRSALKNRGLDKDTRARLQAELRRMGESMKVLRQRRHALANPWLKDGPRKRSYEDALREATREFRRDSEIVVKVAMNDVFAPPKDAERVEIPGASVAYRSASRQDVPDAFFEGTTSFLIGHPRARPSGPPGSLEPVIDPSNPSKPRTFVVSIQADKDRALQMVKPANESLQALTR